MNRQSIFYQNKQNLLPHLVKIALRHRGDWTQILSNPSQTARPEIVRTIVARLSAGEIDNAIYWVWRFAQELYQLETGEQLLRPTFFSMVGGDCDDQVIFILSFLAFVGVPPEQVSITEGAFNHGPFEHLFLELQTESGKIALDALPKTPFGYTLSTERRPHPIAAIGEL